MSGIFRELLQVLSSNDRSQKQIEKILFKSLDKRESISWLALLPGEKLLMIAELFLGTASIESIESTKMPLSDDNITQILRFEIKSIRSHADLYRFLEFVVIQRDIVKEIRPDIVQLYGAFDPFHIGHRELIRNLQSSHHFNDPIVAVCPLKYHPDKAYLIDSYTNRVVAIEEALADSIVGFCIDIEGDCTLPKSKQVTQMHLIKALSDNEKVNLIFGGDVFLKDLNNFLENDVKNSMIDKCDMNLLVHPRSDNDDIHVKEQIIIANEKSKKTDVLYVKQANFIGLSPSSTLVKKQLMTYGQTNLL